MNKILVVAAHCDDELLGAGCYMEDAINNGDEVYVCCMTSYSDVREEDIDAKMREIHEELGVKKTYIAPYGASAIGNVPHLDKVQFVEGVIIDTGCNIVITHSNNDLHEDHSEVSKITMEAVRYFQRRPSEFDENPIKKVMMMEIPCASLWSNDRFNPNAYVECTEAQIVRKISRVSVYDNVIRESPHPRSPEVIHALATVRGSMCGCKYAEAFHVVYEEI